MFGDECMPEPKFGKNVSLSMKNIEMINDYMQKTRKGFSKTLNLILKEWEKYRDIANYLAEEEEKAVGKTYYPKDKVVNNENQN